MRLNLKQSAKLEKKRDDIMYRLVIVWFTGEKETYDYKTRTDAENAENGFLLAFGNQIQWSTVYRVN